MLVELAVASHLGVTAHVQLVAVRQMLMASIQPALDLLMSVALGC